MLDEKKIKQFENAVMRLAYSGASPPQWVMLEDADFSPTLLCELISDSSREYMKEKHGYDIDAFLPESETENILIVVDRQDEELLHVFETGGQFNVDLIANRSKFYEISSEVNFWGILSYKNPRFNRGVQVFFALLCIGFVFSLIFKK